MSEQTAQVIDREVLVALEADTSRELVPELVDIFLKTADERILRIRDKLSEGDLDGIAAEAHALKSSSATFGASNVRKISADLEQAGKTGNRGQAEQYTTDLVAALEIARRALAEYIDELSL